MNKLKKYEQKTSWKEQFPYLLVYQSKETGYMDIDMKNVCDREKKLTFNPSSFTGFDEIRQIAPDYQKDLFRPHTLKHSPNRDYLHELCSDLIKIFKEYFRKVWNPKQFHLIYASGGRDSRIIGLILKELENEGMDLGDLLFLCHEPEHLIFKKAWEEMGWDESKYMVWKEGKGKEIDYYRIGGFGHNMNGYIAPRLLFRDESIDESKTCLVSGSFSPGYRGQSHLTEFFMSRWAGYSAVYDYNLWDDILFPFLNYEYLAYTIFSNPKYFVSTEDDGGDIVRDCMCKLLGSKTPFYIGHNYNLTFSQDKLQKLDHDFYDSTFCYCFVDAEKDFVNNLIPSKEFMNRKCVTSKTFGLATMFEDVDTNNKEFDINLEKTDNKKFKYVI